MRKEPMKKFYANGIERVNQRDDLNSANLLLKKAMKDIHEMIKNRKIQYYFYPIINPMALQILRASEKARTVKNEQVEIFVTESETINFIGVGFSQKCIIINYMRLTKNSI